MNNVKLFFKYALVLFFVGGGVNHFVNTDFYVSIMPDFLPAHVLLVQLSGLTEIASGLLLAIPRLCAVGAWCIIAHLLVFLLVHFNMAAKPDDYADFASPAVLYVRIPIQFVMIAWAYWFTRETPPVPIENTDDGT